MRRTVTAIGLAAVSILLTLHITGAIHLGTRTLILFATTGIFGGAYILLDLHSSASGNRKHAKGGPR